MFPLHQSDEVFFKISSNTDQQPIDLILPHDSTTDDSNLKFDMGSGRPPPQKLLATSDNENSDGIHKKKMMHREIERKRRKDMAKLHGSLRSLLPLEYIKGKRSISDHMNEAVNYIRHLQNKLKELSAKRNELKKLSNLIALDQPEMISGTSAVWLPICVVVHPSSSGVEIMVRSSLEEQGLPLSTVLRVLFKEGLAVLSCVSAKVNERLIYTIQSEVTDITRVDLSGLQQKLTKAIERISE